MKLRFPPGQNFECTACAKCCHGKGWSIAVDPKTAAKLKGSFLELRVLQDKGIAAIRRDEKGNLVVAKDQGTCVFLQEDKLCGVHAEMGVEAKPAGCRQFPFLFTRTPDGVEVGVSYFCTSVQQNSGRPLETYEAELEEMLSFATPTTVGRQAMELVPGIAVPWPVYKVLEDFLQARLEEDPILAPGRVLWTLCRHLAENPASPSETDLQELLEASREVEPRAEPFLFWMETYFAKCLVGRLEAPDPEQGPEVIQALEQDEVLRFQTVGWEGRYSEAAWDVPWLVAELTRYQKSLLFRKFLVKERPILENLAILYLLTRVLEFYTCLHAVARGSQEPEISDYWSSLDLVEGHLVTHGREAQAMSASFLRFYLEQARRV